VVQISSATGDRRLPTFIANQPTLAVTFSCLGPGRFSVGTLFWLKPCDGTLSTMSVAGQKGVLERLVVRADSHTSWRLLIQEGPK
jgi:hypothetical protein